MNNSVPRIAIIGCGAVTERRHLPALAKLGIKPALLVDINLQRAQSLADAFNSAHISDNYLSHVGEFDAAIVASPHHLHAPVCIDLLRRGIHVLVEKPMALTIADCNAVIAAAEKGKAVLAVGLMRRFLRVAQWVKAALEAEVLGPVESFDFQEGFVYSWPVTSGFFFRKETAGGGVLMDTGAHTLDLLLWWLGDVASFEYYDDSYGGVEADCKLDLTLASGAQGVVELSRTRELRNTAILRGRLGEIEVSLDKNYLTARPKEILAYRNGAAIGNVTAEQAYRELKELFVLQIKDWLRAIETGVPPHGSGLEAARSIALIEACYRRRKLLELPWVTPNGSNSKRHESELKDETLQVKAEARV
jgi:predicted dehydrogenase